MDYTSIHNIPHPVWAEIAHFMGRDSQHLVEVFPDCLLNDTIYNIAENYYLAWWEDPERDLELVSCSSDE